MSVPQQGVNMDAVLSRDDSFSNFLKESMAAAPPADGKAKKIAKKPPQERDLEGVTTEGADENLGENFEETPWLPPSIEKAIEFRKKSIYHGGEIRIESLNLVGAPDLGAGTTLYFQFAFTMSICLFVMSIFSLPSLVFIYNGTGIKQEDQDAFGLYKYTLGNIGAQDYGLVGSRCTSGAYAYNETCIHYGDSEITVTEAANIMTAMEWLQIFTFFLGIIYLQQKSFSVNGRNAKSQTSISDYTVEVHNIPPDTKDWQLLQHFSDLYALDKVDWKHRPTVEGCFPVSDVGNTHNEMHMNTWVAECTLHKGIGSFIASFKDKQYLMEKLYRCRAQMKMYAENSPHEGGHKLNRYLRAEQNMIATGTLIDKLTEDTIKKKKLKIIVNTDEEHGGARPGSSAGGARNQQLAQNTRNDVQISNPKSIYRNIDAPAVSAYITFNYSESRARCLEDYERYNSLPYSLFYPKHLMFRGYKIHVHRAPEPDQIVWENLEISKTRKMYMRGRTAIIAVVLVILSFIVILQAAIYKNIFSDSIPAKEICDEVIPTLYANGSKAFTASQLVLTRPPEEQIIAKDAYCTQTVGDSFYAVYTLDGNFSNPVAKYDVNACTTYGFCPSSSQSAFCPCISTTSKQDCVPYGCGEDDDSLGCVTFRARSIGVCYCYSALSDGLSANGVVSTMQKLDSGQGDTTCKAFYRDYTLSVGLTYASVATTTIANTLLRTYLKVLAKQEAHTSSDEEEGSIMSKNFRASYAMMAIIVLIAYGRSSSTPKILEDLHIFVGPYEDFTRAWYGNIGFYLMTTFIIQSFSPLVYNLFEHFVGKPLLRYYHHDRVRKLQSTSVVMQHDLNMLEVGPVFDSTTHTAQLLVLLFFAMTFAPGLPLLMPLCCFAFILYFRIDKFLLCRFYQKPPQLGDAAIRIVIEQLPWAAVIRLAFAAWMFGSTVILPDASTGTTQSSTLSHVGSGVGGHILRENTLPLFVLMLIIVAGKLFLKFLHYLPIYWILKFIFVMASEMQGRDKYANVPKPQGGDTNYSIHPWELVKTNHPDRQQVAPYCGEYMRFIKHKDEIPDSCMQMFSYAYLTNMDEAELEDGWEIRHQGDFVIKVKVWKEVKKRSHHKRGDLKKTWEVVADHRCATYNIEKIPAYVIPMQGLREGTLSMMEYQIRAQQDKNVVDAVLFADFDAGNVESNVIANYNKRKTLKPGETMEVIPSRANAKARVNAINEDDEDADYAEEAEDQHPADEKPAGQNKAKPAPTQHKSAQRGILVESSESSFIGGTTPHGPQTSKSTISINSITATPKSKASSTPTAAPLPAYLMGGDDDIPGEERGEVHKPYFPKSRSSGPSADSADDEHKPYFPAARSDSSDGHHKKKKDKKKKDKKDKGELHYEQDYGYELPAVAAPSPAHSKHSSHGSAPHTSKAAAAPAFNFDAYEQPDADPYAADPYADPYAEPYGTGYDEEYGYGGEGYDDDEGAGVGGLI